LAEALEPKYRSLRVRLQWFIRSICGEPSGEPPVEPCRQCGPESVVQAQLEALKNADVLGVLRFASPRNLAAFEGSAEAFSEMLRTSTTYSPLFACTSAEVLRCIQLSFDRAFAVVGVTAQHSRSVEAPPEKYVFGWALKLQMGSDGRGEYEGCWMTDAVYPLGGGGLYVI